MHSPYFLFSLVRNGFDKFDIYEHNDRVSPQFDIVQSKNKHKPTLGPLSLREI